MEDVNASETESETEEDDDIVDPNTNNHVSK